MTFLDKIISALENQARKDIKGYVKLSDLNEEERARMIEILSEKRESLRNLLTIAYENGIESLYCCAGHDEPKYGNDRRYGYVIFKVTNENLEKLRQIGKILSNYGIKTNFDEHYLFGTRCNFRPAEKPQNKDWFNYAIHAIEEPDKMNNNPTSLYNENLTQIYEPPEDSPLWKVIKVLKKINGDSVKMLEAPIEKAEQNSVSSSFRDNLKFDVTTNANLDKNNQISVDEKNIGLDAREDIGGEVK